MLASVCVFDLNGTLLDVGALDPLFKNAFGAAEVRQVWFDQTLQLALAATVMGQFQEFEALAGAALDMTAVRRGAKLSQEDRQAILAGMRRLPAFPDVAPSLKRLHEAGVRLAALTNSSSEAARAQVEFAGLTPLFEQVLSVDAVRKFKPAPETYRMAAERLGVATGEVRLVAAHHWDTAGAQGAGCATAYVSRPGQALNPLGPTPDMVGEDLADVAGKIIARRPR